MPFNLAIFFNHDFAVAVGTAVVVGAEIGGVVVVETHGSGSGSGTETGVAETADRLTLCARAGCSGETGSVQVIEGS